MKKLLVAWLLTFVSTVSLAQQAPSLEQLQKLDEIQEQEDQTQRALDALDRLSKAVDAISRQREADCMKAVGHQKLCSCLTQNLPVSLSFSAYVAVTTKTKQQNGYTSMSADDRKAYDAVPAARNLCVASAYKKP